MKTTHLLLSTAILLSGCSTFVPILGSERGWGDASQIKVLDDISVSGLRIRVTTPTAATECAKGTHHTIEIDGPINKDTVFALKKILTNLPACIGSAGKKIAKTVYLNSSGGTLNDGFAIGKVFREVGVSTSVTEGQVCASSCAVAFLGGTFRDVSHTGKLVFHAPYRRDPMFPMSIVCAEKSEVEILRSYYRQMIPGESSERLFERTMDYCSRSEGWTVDAGAAKFFGLLR